METQNTDPPEAHDLSDVNIVRMAFGVEGGMAGLALFTGWLGFFEHSQPLASIDIPVIKNAVKWGLLGMIPMLAYLLVFHFWPLGILRDMRTFVDEHLVPLFRSLQIHHFVVIALLAGFCEEIFFRWCLQGGIASWIGGDTGMIVGLVVASIVFGVCHWVNFSYAFCTTVVGVYLGLMMVWTGTWLAPAITHALFDFIALLYIANKQEK